MDILPSEDYENSVFYIKTEMMPYYIENGLEWDDDKRLESYRSCALYSITKREKIGFLMLREDDEEIYLAEFHIFSKHRNEGYGTAVLSKVSNIASSLGYSSIRVKVFKNSPAYPLYLRNGYDLEHELTHTFQLVAQTHNNAIKRDGLQSPLV